MEFAAHRMFAAGAYGGRFFDSFAQAYDGPVWSADLPVRFLRCAGGPAYRRWLRRCHDAAPERTERTCLAGRISLGALVAMEMANRHPER